MTTELPTLLFGSVSFLSAQTDADEGTAAVADHDRDRKRNDGQWEDDCVCRIAVGAEISSVSNKNLVYDVIKRTDQKRNDTGNGILPHEFFDALSP